MTKEEYEALGIKVKVIPYKEPKRGKGMFYPFSKVKGNISTKSLTSAQFKMLSWKYRRGK